MRSHKAETSWRVTICNEEAPCFIPPPVKCGRNVSLGEKIAARKWGTVGWSEGVAEGIWKRAGICLVRRQRDPHAYTYAYARACTYVESTRCHVRPLHPFHTREPHVHLSLSLSAASTCYKRNSRFASWSDVVYIRGEGLSRFFYVDVQVVQGSIGIFRVI